MSNLKTSKMFATQAQPTLTPSESTRSKEEKDKHKIDELFYYFPDPPNIRPDSNATDKEKMSNLYSLISVFGRNYPSISNIATMFGPKEEWDKRIVGHRPFSSREQVQDFIIYCRENNIPRSHLTISTYVPQVITDDHTNLANVDYLTRELKKKFQPFIDSLRQSLHIKLSESVENEEDEVKAEKKFINSLFNNSNSSLSLSDNDNMNSSSSTIPENENKDESLQTDADGITGNNMKMKMNEIEIGDGKKFKTHIPSAYFKDTQVDVKSFNHSEFDENNLIQSESNSLLFAQLSSTSNNNNGDSQTGTENKSAPVETNIVLEMLKKNNVNDFEKNLAERLTKKTNQNHHHHQQKNNVNHLNDLNYRPVNINIMNNNEIPCVGTVSADIKNPKKKNKKNRNQKNKNKKNTFTNSELLKIPANWRTDKNLWVVQFISNDHNGDKFKEPIIISRGFFKDDKKVEDYKKKYLEYYSQHRRTLHPESTDKELLDSIIGHYDLVVIEVDQSKPAWYSRNHVVSLNRAENDFLGKKLDDTIREEKNKKYTEVDLPPSIRLPPKTKLQNKIQQLKNVRT